MTPDEAKKIAKKNLSINISRIIDELIIKIDEILVREIDGLLEGGFQSFKMDDFSKYHLTNNDLNMYRNNRMRVIEGIIRIYNNQGWKARKLTDVWTIAITIRKAE